MCRLLGYLGKPIQLDKLLYQPEHSLIVQSYQPKEMTAGLLNADGFGVGWFNAQKDDNPYFYKNILPIWSDINLPHLSRYVESNCILGYVRSATPPLAVDLSNCQPFTQGKLLFIHNGFIHHFRKTLYRLIRNQLTDETYQLIYGTTDSEHIFALVINELQTTPDISLATALKNTLLKLTQLAQARHTYFSANIILSDGQQLVASRYANRQPVPSLYWLEDNDQYLDAAIVASEPLFAGDWQAFPVNSILEIDADRKTHLSLVEKESKKGELTHP